MRLTLVNIHAPLGYTDSHNIHTFFMPTKRCLSGASSEETYFAFEINYGGKALSAPDGGDLQGFI